MKAAIVCIGNELLKGFTLNTNLHWLTGKLDDLGLEVVLGLEVRDIEPEIISYLKLAQEKADIIIVTGGLGPTSDDITRQSFINAFGLEGFYEKKLLKIQEEFYGHSYENMALLPKGATILFPAGGTAAGWQMKIDNQIFFVMPGVPEEAQNMFNEHLQPYLSSHIANERKSTSLRFFNIKETVLEEELIKYADGFDYGLLPKRGLVDVYFTARGTDQKDAENKYKQAEQHLKTVFSKNYLGNRESSPEGEIGKRFKKSGKTVCVAESLTGGLIANRITNIPGSSKYFLGSVTSYSEKVKMKVLGVKQQTIEKHGAVSAQTVFEMAEGAKNLLGTDYAIASTGNAGPTGSENKPIGLCYIAVATPTKTITRELKLHGRRSSIKNQTALQSLILLLEQL